MRAEEGGRTRSWIAIGHRHAGKDGIDGGTEVVPAHRDVVARAGAVELAPIGEPAVGTEEEQVRRACGVIGLRLRLQRRRHQARDAGAARAATVVVSIIVAAGSFAATDGGAG
jgi:hypothetical protein